MHAQWQDAANPGLQRWNRVEPGTAMTIYREQLDSCLIEADALDLESCRHWKPWLRLTRRAGGVSDSRTFDGLKSLFGTERAALRYAVDLGRRLVDEKSALAPNSADGRPASRPANPAFARAWAYRSCKGPLAQGCRTATHMVRALARVFARPGSAGDLPR